MAGSVCLTVRSGLSCSYLNAILQQVTNGYSFGHLVPKKRVNIGLSLIGRNIQEDMINFYVQLQFWWLFFKPKVLELNMCHERGLESRTGSC